MFNSYTEFNNSALCPTLTKLSSFRCKMLKYSYKDIHTDKNTQIKQTASFVSILHPAGRRKGKYED